MDGIEWALLRRSVDFAVAHEVLWDWSHRLGFGGVSWHGHLADTLARNVDLTKEEKSHLLFRRRDAYEQATLDFMQLQHIDYRKAFSCRCNGGVTADGITLGHHLKDQYLVSPAAASSASYQPDELVAGLSMSLAYDPFHLLLFKRGSYATCRKGACLG